MKIKPKSRGDRQALVPGAAPRLSVKKQPETVAGLAGASICENLLRKNAKSL